MGWSHGRDPHQTALGVPVRVPQRKMRPLPRADLPPPLGPVPTGFWGQLVRLVRYARLYQKY